MTMKQFNKDREIRNYRKALSISPATKLWQVELLLEIPKWRKILLKSAWRCHTGQMTLMQAGADNVIPVIIMKYLIKKYF